MQKEQLELNGAMKKTKIILILSIIILLIISVLILIPEKSTSEMKEILFILDLPDEATDAVERQLVHYGNINRHVAIEYIPLGDRSAEEIYSDIAPEPQIFTWKGPFAPTDDKDFSEPVLWIGDKWFLAVNIDALQSKTIEKMKIGISIEEFEDILIELKERGITPLSLGNSHRWPLVLWEQHLEAALSVSRLVGKPDLDEDFTESREAAWDKLRDWNERGFFLEEVWDEGWAVGIQAVSDDNAAIALMAEKMLGSISPEKREKILFLPFPGSTVDYSWTIGSGYSLILRADTEEHDESLKLMQYLTSEAVVEILREESGSPFHSSAADRKNHFIPSWDSLANTQTMREYGEALNQYVSK